MSRLASRARRCLRLPALVLLLLATLVNPVFAAVGDTHEAARGVAEHLHDRDEHTLAQDAAHDEDGNGDDLLHALMHASHACGHLTAIPAGLVLTVAAFVGSAAPHSVSVPGQSAPISSDIRPPIGV